MIFGESLKVVDLEIFYIRMAHAWLITSNMLLCRSWSEMKISTRHFPIWNKQEIKQKVVNKISSLEKS